MPETPCEKEYREYVEAMNNWVQVSNATSEFVVTEPLGPYEDIAPKPVEYFDRMVEAYRKEEEARKIYFDKLRVWLDCRENR